jgi:hypothetical protein
LRFRIEENVRQYGLILAAALAALIAGYWFGHRTAPAAATVATPHPANPSITAPAPAAGGAAPAIAKSTTGTRTASGAVAAAASAAPHASAPLPAPGTPLKDTFAELKSRADSGDGEAATRLFHDLQNCAQVQRLNQFMPGLANRLLNNNQPTNGPAAQAADHMLGMVQRSLNFVSDNAALCADVTTEQMADLVPATLQAAQSGDAVAADCYVGANLNSWPDVLNNPNWVSDYKNSALPIATSALQQGDWTMASLMAQAYAGSVRSNSLFNQVTGTNLTQAYTYAKLMSLGQPASSAPSNRLTNGLTALSAQLTPDQIQAADAQAQQMYQQYFKSTPREPGAVTNTMRACQSAGPGF